MNPWIKIALQVGVPSAIACYLVWVMSTQIVSEVRETRKELSLHAGVASMMLDTQQRTERALSAVVDITRANCAANAKTDAARDRCDAAGR